MSDRALPRGFRAAGRNVGIKNRKRDCGVIVADHPVDLAAVLTANRSRAANIDRIARIASTEASVRAVLAVSGNANALTGPEGATDDERLAEALAKELDIRPEEVLTAYTGTIGRRLPRERVASGLIKVLGELERTPAAAEAFAESIMTTDQMIKVATRDLFLGGTRVRIHGVVKGAGMIAPSMATMVGFVTTDAAVAPAALRASLIEATAASFNMLTVDDDMSTNDLVLLMASGDAGNQRIELGTDELALWQDVLTDLLIELARAIATDGEGATRRFEVLVKGAPTRDAARTMARDVANSPLVKTAVFGADPNAGGRIVASAGASAARHDVPFALDRIRLELQGALVCDPAAGALVERPELRERMKQPLVETVLDLGAGEHEARAFGCDLSFDYVKINADYVGVTYGPGEAEPAEDASPLSGRAPKVKRDLLIEALRYIDEFKGIRAVIKLGGAAMVEPELERQFAESVLLLRNVGLLPIVVHGGGPEISRTLKALGRTAEFVDGLRVTDVDSMHVVEMVLSGSVNQRLVAALNRKGARAVGLSGKDGGLIRARKLVAGRDLGQVGEVDRVDPSLIDLLEAKGYVPVVSPVGLGDDGLAFNINADVVAARLASALGAAKLIYLSDVPGLLDGDEVVSELDGDQLKARLDRGEITGGMKPKLEAALGALRQGVASVHLVDGRVPHNLIAELFTDRGVGTLIRQT